VDPHLLAEAEAAVEYLLPRFGAPIARRLVELPHGRLHLLEAGDGPSVLLLHGGFGGAGNWYRTLGPLARRFRVLAPDRPGFGLSAPDPRDHLAWLDGLLAALGVRRVALVGHAGGGALALAYAQARRESVAALALSDLPLAAPGAPAAMNTAPPSPPAHDASGRAPGLGGRGGRLPPGLGSRAGGARPPELRSRGDRPSAGRATLRPRRVETWYASLAARFDDRRLLAPEYLYYLWCLARLRPEQDQRPPGVIAPGPVPIPGPGERTWPTVPTLLLWGRGNRWAGAPVARQLHQRIPDAWLRVIEHSKGIPNLEQPGEFNYAALNFLAAHLPRG
jgi:pimeloyl-ACP methyl ester carboxylesterase